MSTTVSARSAELENAYDAWRFAADEAADALHAWQAGARDARGATYTAYRAALDREEQAARSLEALGSPGGRQQ
jgi:protein-disulfide isomerase